MSARVVGIAVAAILLSGCENAISVALDVRPEDLVALAIIEADGVPRVVELREGEAPSLLIEEGARAYAFVVAHAELRNLDGTPLTRDATRAADIRLDDEPRAADKGLCGFCVLPAMTPPQRVSPGDSCPLPPFARALDLVSGGDPVDITTLEPVRTRILVDWPGDCP